MIPRRRRSAASGARACLAGRESSQTCETTNYCPNERTGEETSQELGFLEPRLQGRDIEFFVGHRHRRGQIRRQSVERAQDGGGFDEKVSFCFGGYAFGPCCRRRTLDGKIQHLGNVSEPEFVERLDCRVSSRANTSRQCIVGSRACARREGKTYGTEKGREASKAFRSRRSVRIFGPCFWSCSFAFSASWTAGSAWRRSLTLLSGGSRGRGFLARASSATLVGVARSCE